MARSRCPRSAAPTRISFQPIRLENRALVGPCARARALSTRTPTNRPPPPSLPAPTNARAWPHVGTLPHFPHHPHRTGPTCRRPCAPGPTHLAVRIRRGCEWNDRKCKSPVGKSRMGVNPNVWAPREAAAAPLNCGHGPPLSSTTAPPPRRRPYASNYAVASFFFWDHEGDGRVHRVARRFEDRRSSARSLQRAVLFPYYTLSHDYPSPLLAR